MQLGEARKVAAAYQQRSRLVHSLRIERQSVAEGRIAPERVFAQRDVILILALYGVETGMRVVADPSQSAHGNVVGQHGIQMVAEPGRIVHRPLRVEMGHIERGMHARIGPAGPDDGSLVPEQCGERLLHGLLHGRIAGLHLPPAIGFARIGKFQKITHLIIGLRTKIAFSPRE